jgi:peptidyl-tRNA hydrolase
MSTCSTQVIEAAQSEPKKVEVDVLTHYVIVRRDLPPGTQAAQIIHAAGESSPGNLPSHTYAVALTCTDECELYELAIRLDAAGIKHKVIAEPDEPYNGAFMAIGIFPKPRSQIRRHLSNLPLLK